MPNRIIKDSIRTSKTINAMTDFQFRLWVYLITYVDDYGRGSADPELLKGFVFPRRKGVTESTIEKALADLANSGSILLYDVDGESYFCFPNWGDHQRIQNKKSKFPAPELGELREVTVTHGDSPPESNTNSNPNTNYNPEDDALTREQLDRLTGALREATVDWLIYKKERRQGYQPTGLKSLITEIKNNADEHGDKAVIDVIRQSMSNNYQGIVFDRLKPKQVASTGSAYDRMRRWADGT